MKTDPTIPTPASARDGELNDIDVVLLDDNQIFADAFKFRFMRKKVAHFLDPREFVAQASCYPKATIICIDNDFGMVAPVSRMQIAQQLHEMGFTRLFLVSGTYFSEEQLPDYLIFIEKINLEYFNFM